ncbi:SWI/SNF-related matrix-associated actin-dependent regulator of chromatin subfamily A containing DEAD/H box 1A isoform X2 [Vanacampus margaritifer]
MSQFNLERFRFQKSSTCNVSSESEKENKPAQMKSTESHLSKSHARGVVFEDVDEADDDDADDEPLRKVSFTRKFRDPMVKPSNVTDDKKEEEEKSKKQLQLSEMFPHLSSQKLSEVVGSTSTLDGAVATCVLISDDEDTDNVRKEKQDSDSSLQSGETQPNQRRKQSGAVGSTSTQPGAVDEYLLISDDDDDVEFVSKRKQNGSNSSLESSETQPNKRRKQSEVSEDKVVDSSDDNPDGGDKPSWEKQEVMVKRLHKKFPNLDKEELRSVLQEHNWDDVAALHALQMFSSPDEIDFRSPECTPEKSHHVKNKEGEEQSEERLLESCHNKMDAKILSRFASGTSMAKKRAEERKREAHAAKEPLSSDDDDDDDDDDEDAESSDLDNYKDVLANTGGVKEEIVKFFQEATRDELTLISGCSVKKAKKIIELRPFTNWLSLTNQINKSNGLSEDLLPGCKTVLKERTIVRGLMSKCENISSEMVKQVTEVMRAGTAVVLQPGLLNSKLQLKPYQVIGLKWLLLMYEHNLSGILADEMGLGKTIQAIALLAHLLQNGTQGPHLITVPASTLDNWVRELQMWCPRLKVLVYAGSVEDRQYLKYDILNGAMEFNVLVTTYNLAIGNNSDRSLFRKLRLVYAVFDEGHMLKNMNTMRYRHLMSINAKHRLLLTGTPLQNNLLELMSLLNFIMPSMFSSTTVQLSKMFSMKSQEDQSQFEKERISEAKRIMKPFILRRVKNEVLKQLPNKEEKVEFCSMSEKQQVLYQALWTKLKASTTSEKRELTNVMMHLRKMANHPLLHRQYYTTEKLKAMSKLMLKEPTHHDANAELIQEDMEVMSDFELHRLCQQYTSISSYQLDSSLLLDSGKFSWLAEKLASLKDKGDRVVLFSQFTMMLDIVEVLMKHLNHRYIRLDGSTPIADRIVLIDQFNNDADLFVFLLSTRAGGLGINLTSANVVILHDIDWNPYNDKQAEDRCHRLGQTRTVQVIKLISKDSIEDGILQLGQKKLKLEQDMTTAEQSDEGAIPEDIASLLKASLGM